MLALGLAACGSDDSDDGGSGGGGGGPDGASLAEEFGVEADTAYADQGMDRDKDFAQGVLMDQCFVLDTEAAKAVGAAAGAEGPSFRIADTNYLSGVPGEDEVLNCSLASSGEQIAVIAGATLVDADGQLERLQRGGEGLEEFDGTAEGLDDSDVVAAKGGGVARLAWVNDGFVVAITGPEDVLGGEAGFAALSAAVEGVDSTLSG